MLGRRKAWRDLEPAERAAIVLGGVVQIALQVAALVDLRRRTDDELVGPRKLWAWVSFVNFLGPIAYFLVGRRVSGGCSAEKVHRPRARAARNAPTPR